MEIDDIDPGGLRGVGTDVLPTCEDVDSMAVGELLTVIVERRDAFYCSQTIEETDDFVGTGAANRDLSGWPSGVFEIVDLAGCTSRWAVTVMEFGGRVLLIRTFAADSGCASFPGGDGRIASCGDVFHVHTVP